TGYGITADVAGLEAHPIHHADIDSIGNGVRPLDGAPGVVLRRAEFRLLRWMPADRRGIKQNARSLQCREARRFGIPLVPANQRAQLSGGGVEGLESEIAGREII